MRFRLKDGARHLGAFIVAPIIVAIGLMIVDAARRGWRFAVDPEGIAYLIAFTLMALPGLLIGLLAAGYVLRSFAEFSFFMKLGLAALAGTVGSCVGSAIILLLVARPLGIQEFFPALLILPSLLGIAGGLLLALFSWPRSAGNV